MDLLDFHTHGYHSYSIHNVIVGKETGVPEQFFSAGLHPWYLDVQKMDLHLQELQQLTCHEKCVALGEAGLDKLSDTSWQLQMEAFEKQIELANKVKKPMIIHCVKAHQEVIKLKEKATVPWVLHGFNQKAAIGELVLQADFYISFGRALLQADSNASKFIPQVPIERIFLETDDAEMPIKEVYQAASERLHLPIEKLASILHTNFDRLAGRRRQL